LKQLAEVRLSLSNKIKEVKNMKKKVIKPFSLEEYNKGAKIKLRKGRNKVRIICTDADNDSNYPIIALVKLYKGKEQIVLYTSEGKIYKNDKECNADLVIVE
jgi:hypothetical protein